MGLRGIPEAEILFEDMEVGRRAGPAAARAAQRGLPI